MLPGPAVQPPSRIDLAKVSAQLFEARKALEAARPRKHEPKETLRFIGLVAAGWIVGAIVTQGVMYLF